MTAMCLTPRSVGHLTHAVKHSNSPVKGLGEAQDAHAPTVQGAGRTRLEHGAGLWGPAAAWELRDRDVVVREASVALLRTQPPAGAVRLIDASGANAVDIPGCLAAVAMAAELSRVGR